MAITVVELFSWASECEVWAFTVTANERLIRVL
jgi:hypothetical protein